MRLTITLATLALAALTACSPLDPPVQFDRAPVEVDAPEGDTCTVNVVTDTCDAPVTPPAPVETVPPTEGCDVTLGGTYNAMTDTCDYPQTG